MNWGRELGGAGTNSLRLVIYVLFVCASTFWFAAAPGDDLSASYVACHLISTGDATHLYDHDPEFFHIVDTPAWNDAARLAGFDGFLHPFVQTPLWGWVLQPLCGALGFDAFKGIFLVSSLVALVACVEIVARTWAPDFLRPLPLVLLLGAVALTTPFKYAMWLVQTHSLFLALALWAIVLASSRRCILAGACLAIAAAVKITPGLLVVYWIITGKWRAVAWFGVSSVVLVLLTVAAVGTEALRDFIGSVTRIADILLVSFNNQSVAAWLGSLSVSQEEIWNWRMLPLPPALKLLSTALSVASVALAGLMARRVDSEAVPVAFALLGLTVFAPIAWTHYYIVLIPGIMLLVRPESPRSLIVPLVVLLLNIPPVALNPVNLEVGPVTLIRSHLLSGVLMMLTFLVGFRARTRDRDGAAAHL